MSDAIHQEVLIPASPAEVYSALTKSKTFSEVAGGAPADIDDQAGGTFSLFGGQIVGRSIELLPDQRVVQAWRAQNWDAGRYSIVRFELRGEGNATRLIFDQEGHPAETHEHLSAGWPKMYWEPLKAHFR